MSTKTDSGISSGYDSRDSLTAKTTCRCKIKGILSYDAPPRDSVLPNPAIWRSCGTGKARSLRSSCRTVLYVGVFAPNAWSYTVFMHSLVKRCFHQWTAGRGVRQPGKGKL